MTTIIRLKRRLDDDISEMLYISSKKPRNHSFENNTGDKVLDDGNKIFLNYIGTSKCEGPLFQRLRSSKKDILHEDGAIHHSPAKKPRSTNHYKVITSYTDCELRDFDELFMKDIIDAYVSKENDPLSENLSKQPNRTDSVIYQMYDIAEDIEINKHGQSHSINTSSSASDDFVYDVYYATKLSLDLSRHDMLSVESCDSPEIESCVDNDSDDYLEDEDDSNDENNWRNDYPDEDFYDSVSQNEYGFEESDSSHDEDSSFFGCESHQVYSQFQSQCNISDSCEDDD